MCDTDTQVIKDLNPIKDAEYAPIDLDFCRPEVVAVTQWKWENEKRENYNYLSVKQLKVQHVYANYNMIEFFADEDLPDSANSLIFLLLPILDPIASNKNRYDAVSIVLKLRFKFWSVLHVWSVLPWLWQTSVSNSVHFKFQIVVVQCRCRSRFLVKDPSDGCLNSNCNTHVAWLGTGHFQKYRLNKSKTSKYFWLKEVKRKNIKGKTMASKLKL